MPIDRKHLGRRYGPFVFTVGLEHVKDFAAAIGGGVPGRVFSSPPRTAHPSTRDERAAARPHGGIVAPPAFAAVFAIEPFSAACSDPELALDVLRLVHGEQEMSFLEVVRPGDVLTTTGEITRIRERGSLELLEVSTTTTGGHGRVVLRAVWTAIIRS